MFVRKYWVTGMVMVLLLSCQANRQLLDEGSTLTYNCPGIITYKHAIVSNIDAYLEDSLLSAQYTPANLYIASAYGLIRDLIVYEYLRAKIKREGKVDPNTFDEFTNAYNRINEGTNLAALEVKSLEDLIECTILKLRKFKFYVANANLKSQNRLSNWAIGVGSATTIITAGILLSRNDDLIASTVFDWIAVAGGVATGYLAYKSSKVNKEVLIAPQDNFIRVIWTGNNQDNLFPPSTWYLLNQPFIDDGIETTLRELIIAEWQSSTNMLGKPENMDKLPILLADDGIYDASLIDLRMEMLEIVGLAVDQVNRALYMFNSKRY
jgi:hypothetical protein